MTTVIVDTKERMVYADTRITAKTTTTTLFIEAIGKYLGMKPKVTVEYSDDGSKIYDMGNYVYAGAGSSAGVSTVAITGIMAGLNCTVVRMCKTTGEVKLAGKGYARNPRYIVMGSGWNAAWRRLYANMSPEDAIMAASLEDKGTSSTVEKMEY